DSAVGVLGEPQGERRRLTDLDAHVLPAVLVGGGRLTERASPVQRVRGGRALTRRATQRVAVDVRRVPGALVEPLQLRVPTLLLPAEVQRGRRERERDLPGPR